LVSPTNLQEDLHNRYELKALMETSRLLIESRDEEFITSNLLLIVMGKLLVNKAAILTYDDGTKSYTVDKVKGHTNLTEQEQVNLNIKESLRKQSVIFFEEEQDVPGPLRDNGLCTLFNLRTGDQHFGFLCLGQRIGKKKWEKREKDFVESLATISAVAMANSEMLDELKTVNRKLDQRVYELNTLLDLSKDFNKLIDRDQIIKIFKFAMLGQLMIKQFFFVLEYEGERELLSVSGIRGEPSEQEIEHMFQFKDDVVRVDEQVQQDNAFLKEHNITRLIALHLQGEKLAVIGIGDRANSISYTESDINFIQSLGNLALLSIQKTFFLEERIEKERMEEELNIAKTIQEGLLPHPLPEPEGLELYAINIPSRQVGGDYFDVILTPQNNCLMAIADVTGKGVPAALLMSNLQAMLQALAPLDITLSEATARINQNLYQNTPPDKFITFFWASYDNSTSKLSYVNAGHNPPLLFRADGSEPEELEQGGLLLGAMSDLAAYEQETIKLESGDLFISFTDGVTEAMSPEEEEFGEERLLALLREHRNEPVKKLTEIIINEIDEFSQGNQFDDVTILIFRKK